MEHKIAKIVGFSVLAYSVGSIVNYAYVMRRLNKDFEPDYAEKAWVSFVEAQQEIDKTFKELTSETNERFDRALEGFYETYPQLRPEE